MKLSNGGRPRKNQSFDTTGFEDDTVTLKQFGISKQQASDWRRMAAIPDDVFELELATLHDTNKPITTHHFVKLGRQIQGKSQLTRSNKSILLRGWRDATDEERRAFIVAIASDLRALARAAKADDA
jgi:hypothetical protein